MQLFVWIPCEKCGRAAKLHLKRELKPAPRRIVSACISRSSRRSLDSRARRRIDEAVIDALPCRKRNVSAKALGMPCGALLAFSCAPDAAVRLIQPFVPVDSAHWLKWCFFRELCLVLWRIANPIQLPSSFKSDTVSGDLNHQEWQEWLCKHDL